MLRKKRAAALLKNGEPRRIRIHSLHAEPPEAPRPKFVRVAFEFLDPPGPWTIQFFEVSTETPETLAQLAAGVKAICFESEDGKRTRVMTTEDGKPLWPR